MVLSDAGTRYTARRELGFCELTQTLPSSFPPNNSPQVQKKSFQPATILYACYLLYICYLTYYLATSYIIKAGIYPVTPALFFVDTFNLYIHEAGHFFFSPFGQTLYVMGGSLFQIILPAFAAWGFLRSGLMTLGFTLFWLGESIVNVSVYVRDAPFMRLHLISRHAIHDWNWICRHFDIMDSADDIATVLLYLGITICIAAVAAGVWSIIKEIRDNNSATTPPAFGNSKR